MGVQINPFILPFPVSVARDETEYRECVRNLGIDPPSIEASDGKTVAVRGEGIVVWVDRGLKRDALFGVAAHEATHAALDLFDMMGEENPGHEILAYMVQSIASGILVACEMGGDSECK